MHFSIYNLPILTIYAISDIYNILSYGRIKTFIDQSKTETSINMCGLFFQPDNYHDHLTVMSGDFISPTEYTNIKNGTNLIINAINNVPIDIVSFGNHEFDIDPLKLNNTINSSTSKTKFISTNIEDISNTLKYSIYNHPTLNFTIGIIGLCTNRFYLKHPVKFLDIEEINKTITFIKNTFNPSMIIGLTHMDIDEDIGYLEYFDSIDLILGGHIHSHDYKTHKNIPIVRTGENANSLYEISIYQDKTFEINLIDISNVIPEKSIYNMYLEGQDRINKLNGLTLFNLSKEYTNINPRNNTETLPQLFCSLVTKYFNSTLTILNAGMFRKKGIFQGNLTFKELREILPFEDTVVNIQMDINDLIAGIEYSHTKYKARGGYIQSDMSEHDIYILKEQKQFSLINVSTVKLLLVGIDSNPYFSKYSPTQYLDEMPIHNLIHSYKGGNF